MIVTNEDRMGCSVHLSEDGRAVEILDQTKLPTREEWLRLTGVEPGGWTAVCFTLAPRLIV